MKTLPDPRHYAAFSANSLVRLGELTVAQGAAMQHAMAAKPLVAAIEQALGEADDRLIAQAFAESTSPAVFRALSSALDRAFSGSDGTGLKLRLFGIPILFVTGGAPRVIPGVLPDIAELQKLFESHGTLGPIKNFALSATLSSSSGFTLLKPSEIYRRLGESRPGDAPPLDLPPEEIRTEGSEEAVHLRLVTGVYASAADAPDFTQTAGHIGAWGLPFTRALATQLAQPGLSLLPIPRLPMSPYAALAAGLFAQNELRFQLFLTSALRKFRSRIGEAAAALAACGDGSIRIRLRSPFDAAMAPEHAWPLARADDIGAVGGSIFSLLEDCRVTDVQVGETVQPASASH